MKTWMLPWLFPVGLLGAVMFVVVFNGYAALIAVPVAWMLLPLLWRMRFPPSGDERDEGESHDWRITRP